MELSKKQLDFIENLQVSMGKGAVQPDELAKIVKVLLEVFKNIKTQLEKDINNTDIKLHQELNNAINEIKILEEKMDNSLGEVSNKSEKMTLAEVSKMAARMEKDMAKMRGEMPEMPNLSDIESRMEKHEKEMKEYNDEMLTLKKVEDALPKFGIIYRNTLEALKDEERLDQSAIRGLEETLKEIRKIASGGTGRMLGGVLNVGVRIETPVGAVDGVNTAFTVYKTPKYIILDGASYFESNGYTLSGKTLTVTVPPRGYIRSFF